MGGDRGFCGGRSHTRGEAAFARGRQVPPATHSLHSRDPDRECKNQGDKKSFPDAMLSVCPTNLGALSTLPTETHHEELIWAVVS